MAGKTEVPEEKVIAPEDFVPDLEVDRNRTWKEKLEDRKLGDEIIAKENEEGAEEKKGEVTA